MTRRLLQWVLFSGIACVLSIIGIVLFQRTGTDVADALLDPWFTVCRAITPESWQTTGNIILGLLWLVSGIVLYSMLIGAGCVIVLAVVDRLRRRAAAAREP